MGQRSLSTVLRLREHREELEEQALAVSSRKLQQARLQIRNLAGELRVLQEDALRQTGALHIGAEMLQREANMRSLKRREAEAVIKLEEFERQHVDQMRLYCAAHMESEAIRALLEQRRKMTKAAQEVRERKSGEELFLGRRAMRQQEVEREAGAR